MRHLAFTLLLVILPVAGSAHHSVFGLYIRGQVSEVEGRLTRAFWRNPHVRFSIEADDGATWEIESAPPTELERYGITKELLEIGARFRVAGDSSRRGDNALFARNILLPDGREILTYPDSTPRWSTDTLTRGGKRIISERAAREAEERANGLFRVWAGGFTAKWDVAFTDAALAARRQWDGLRDDPTLRCIPPGMVEAMVSPYPMELIEDGQDVILRMEEWDGMRRVHMNDSVDPETVPATPMGYSVGRWEGDTLVVTTSRISWPRFDGLGTPQSEDVRMVERFSMSRDEQQLTWAATITDPVNLTRPAVVSQQFDWVPGEEIKPYNCAVLDESR